MPNIPIAAPIAIPVPAPAPIVIPAPAPAPAVLIPEVVAKK